MRATKPRQLNFHNNWSIRLPLCCCRCYFGNMNWQRTVSTNIIWNVRYSNRYHRFSCVLFSNFIYRPETENTRNQNRNWIVLLLMRNYQIPVAIRHGCNINCRWEKTFQLQALIFQWFRIDFVHVTIINNGIMNFHVLFYSNYLYNSFSYGNKVTANQK